MTEIVVPDDWYGPRTKAMRHIAARASEIQWFGFVPSGDSADTVGRLVGRHLDALQAFDHDKTRPATGDVSVLRGTWHLLHAGRWGTDPYDPWGERWSSAAASQGRTIRKLRAAAESNAAARALLRAPLWPIAGVANVCGGTFVVDRAKDEQVRRLVPDERDRCVAWALLCQAEFYVWDALLWELGRGVKAIDGPNPFEPLLELYELGFFPMGWVGNRYDLYTPEPTSTEAEGFAAPALRGENFLSWPDSG